VSGAVGLKSFRRVEWKFASEREMTNIVPAGSHGLISAAPTSSFSEGQDESDES
jgi:hypothetical protein